MHIADNTKVWDYRAWSKNNRGIPVIHRRQLFIVPRLSSRLIATRSTPTTPDKRLSPPSSPEDAGSTQGEKRKRDSQKLEQLQQTIHNNKVVRRNLEMKNRALAIRAVFASSHSPSVARGCGISPQCDNAKQGYLHSLDGVQRATARKRVSELARDVWAGRRSISKPVTGVLLSETCQFQLATIYKLAEIARGTPQVGHCQPSVESEFINVTLTNIRSSVEWAIHNSNSGKIGRMPTATRAGIGALATALQWSEVRGLQLWQQSNLGLGESILKEGMLSINYYPSVVQCTPLSIHINMILL